MNESSISIFIVQAFLALFTFFVAAPCVLNAISTFTVQARLAKAMVEEGVITEADRRMLQPKKQIAGVVIRSDAEHLLIEFYLLSGFCSVDFVN